MPDEAPGTNPLRLREEFPPVSTAEWEAAIQAGLKGADYEKRLVWKTDEGITVRPYYRADDVPAEMPRPIRGGAWLIDEAPLPADAINAAAFHEAGATTVQELAYAIAAASDRFAAGDPPAALIFAAGSNYFFEIAKFRAARLLWLRLREAYSTSATVRIHVVTALENKSLYDPYTNLLRSTTEALSAVIGGCDSLEVVPARFSPHLALNVQRILLDEAHLDKVEDPAGGSYYIEALTDALASEAWALFQQIESEGGWAKVESSRAIEKAITSSRAAREKAFASRRRVLVGVNNYPDLGETALGAPSPLAGAAWRLAMPVERIRLRTERHTKSTGRRPKILLLKRGGLRMKMARATFCMNFFGCGGFAVEESEDYAGTDADLIVLCSSDPEYLALAGEVCPRVKAPVLVAGNPKEQIEALRQAGVAGFVHVLSNLVDTLLEWQDRLGVEE